MDTFVELTDNKGQVIRLRGSGLILGTCDVCQQMCAAFQNEGQMRCTHCGGPVLWQWTKPQLSFIPDGPSEYQGWDRGKKKKAK